MYICKKYMHTDIYVCVYVYIYIFICIYIYIIIHDDSQIILVCMWSKWHVCQIPLKMLHHWNPPNPETQIPGYKFKRNKNLNLKVYREISRNPSFSIFWILGVQQFQWKLLYMAPAQGWTNRTLAVHERTSVHFLVLPGSLLSITEITEYAYFSPLKPIHELRYKSE